MTTTRTAEAGRPAALKLEYLPVDSLAVQPDAWWRTVLGVVGFERLPPLPHRSLPVTASRTPTLRPERSLCEVWRVVGRAGELREGTAGALAYRWCEDWLFGALSIEEHLKDGGGRGAQALRGATETAYRQIFAALQATGHAHLIRIWNYLPDINREVDGEERYRHFNAARQAAFRHCGRAATATAPAACALGSPAGSPLAVYFLAAQQAPRMIENPRQVSAYHYPPQYGRASPMFSRACVLSASAGSSLFVSGTASIVGHETVHRGDVIAQTRETVANIRSLLTEANRVLGAQHYTPEGLTLKVYVRHRKDLAAIGAALEETLKSATPAIYLQAEICRGDLLVEIEATGEAQPSFPRA